jgi:cell division septation protein DedD
MKDFTDDKPEKDTSEEIPVLSDRDPEDSSEVEEEYSEEDTLSEMDTSPQAFASMRRQKWSKRSLILVLLLCVVFGVLLLVVISFMKPEEKRPQIVDKRIKPSIETIEREKESTISGIVGRKETEEKPVGEALPEGEKSIVAKPLKSSVAIQERGPKKEMSIPGGEEVPKQEIPVPGAEVEGRKLEIEKREQGKSQVAMVEESKGRAVPAEGKRPRGRYTVNVASFRERVRAERLTKELEKKGYKAFVEEAPISKKGTWYRVAVGRFSSRGEAQTFARTLKEKEKMDSFVRELKEAKK